MCSNKSNFVLVVFDFQMKFKSKQEKIEWLKNTAEKIRQMELDRRVCILKGDFDKAVSLLKGIKFARMLFAKISRTTKV